MANSLTILWQGNVTLRTGVFVKSAFAEISEGLIDVRKDEQESSQSLHRITPSQVKSLTIGKGDFSEVFVKGYQGFIINYENEGNNGLLRFWPKGFGQFPNSKELPRFSEALAKFANVPAEQLANSKSINPQNAIALSALSIIAIVACGALPGLIIVASVFGATYLWNKESMDPTLRKVLAVLLVGAAVGFGLLLNVLVALLRTRP